MKSIEITTAGSTGEILKKTTVNKSNLSEGLAALIATWERTAKDYRRALDEKDITKHAKDSLIEVTELMEIMAAQAKKLIKSS